MEHFIEILKYSIEILAILGVTIEIIPVKFSPLGWLGDRINKNIRNELKDIRNELNQVKRDGDYREIGALRSRISSFDLLVRKDKNLDTLERHQYITALKDIDKWDNYHKIYKDLNGELKLAIENIRDCYKRATFND